MFTISIHGGVIDVFEIQSEMNSIVLSSMGERKDWESAFSNLENLLSEATKFFFNYIQNGNRPTANEYWYFFADIISNLCFNYGIALFEFLAETIVAGSEFEKSADAYATAANMKPNDQTEEYIKFLKMVSGNYEHALSRQGILSRTSLLDYTLAGNYDLEQNLVNFYTQIRDGRLPM